MGIYLVFLKEKETESGYKLLGQVEAPNKEDAIKFVSEITEIPKYRLAADSMGMK